MKSIFKRKILIYSGRQLPQSAHLNNNFSLCLSYMLGLSARNVYRGNLERLEVIDPSKGFVARDFVSVTRLSF